MEIYGIIKFWGTIGGALTMLYGVYRSIKKQLGEAVHTFIESHLHNMQGSLESIHASNIQTNTLLGQMHTEAKASSAAMDAALVDTKVYRAKDEALQMMIVNKLESIGDRTVRANAVEDVRLTARAYHDEDRELGRSLVRKLAARSGKSTSRKKKI